MSRVEGVYAVTFLDAREPIEVIADTVIPVSTHVVFISSGRAVGIYWSVASVVWLGIEGTAENQEPEEVGEPPESFWDGDPVMN